MKRMYLLLIFSIICISSYSQDLNSFVDLGLSVKWASCNIGASKPEEFGHYYAWGETSTKKDYSWKTYKFGTYEKGMSLYNTKDNYTSLLPDHDVATLILGKNYRIPTKEEYQELLDKCKWQLITINGVKGYKVLGPNGNSIFLPIAGYYINTSLGYSKDNNGEYWTSSRVKKEAHCAYHLFISESTREVSAFNRCHGRTIRPVCDK